MYETASPRARIQSVSQIDAVQIYSSQSMDTTSQILSQSVWRVRCHSLDRLPEIKMSLIGVGTMRCHMRTSTHFVLIALLLLAGASPRQDPKDFAPVGFSENSEKDL